jgi:heat-inducible transcriptional repressor
VRHILAHLEQQGFVRQPHTSSGRVPTDSGYRLYVDLLLRTRRKARTLPEIEARLRRAGTVTDLLENASQEMSRASHQIGFALAQANPAARLRHIDFVSLDNTRVLVIVVAAGGQITHKVIETETRYDGAMLTEAANYINAEFTGLTLADVRASIEERMREERMLYDELLQRALSLAQTGLSQVEPGDTLHVQGASLLIEGLTGNDTDREHMVETLQTLFRMIEEKHQLVELLTRSIEATGLTIVIGSEHTSPDFHPFSLVASTFQDGDRTGTVGVIGPTRMRYQRAISVVDGVSQTMTRLLEGQ